MYNYIYSEEEILLRIAEKFTLNFPGRFKRLFIIGCGSSFNSGKIVEPFFLDMGMTVTVMHPMEFITTQKNLNKEDLAILISQVGNSALIVKALRFLKGRCQSLGLTSNSNGIIAQEADFHININCGEENCNAKSLGMSSTVLNLMLFGLSYALKEGYISQERYNAERGELLEIIGRLKEYTLELDVRIQPFINSVKRDNSLWFLGSGYNYSVTREFAMKVVECSYLKTNYKEIEEFLHGFEMEINSKDMIVILAFDDNSRELAKGIKKFMRDQEITQEVYIVSNKDCDILTSATDSKYNIFVNLALLQLSAYYLGVKFGVNIVEPRYKNINEYVVTKL